MNMSVLKICFKMHELFNDDVKDRWATCKAGKECILALANPIFSKTCFIPNQAHFRKLTIEIDADVAACPTHKHEKCF